MEIKSWKNTEHQQTLEVRFDCADISNSKDGIHYTVKPWNVRSFGIIGAGFIDDSGSLITVRHGTAADNYYNPMLVVTETSMP